MNFCQFFNRTMKTLNKTWIPIGSINVFLGILGLIGTVMLSVITIPFFFMVDKISAMHLFIPKIKIDFGDICKPIVVIIAATLLAIEYQRFLVYSFTFWNTVFYFFVLNSIYIGEVLFLTICIKNYKDSMKYLAAGMAPYIFIRRIIQFGYNKTSSSCPLKKE